MYQAVHCYIVFNKETVDHVPKCKAIPNIKEKRFGPS